MTYINDNYSLGFQSGLELGFSINELNFVSYLLLRIGVSGTSSIISQLKVGPEILL